MIKKLSDAYAPSGREEEVRKIIINELSDFYDDIRIDNLGNLIIHKPGKTKCVAVTAPMDEVGFIITHNDSPEFVVTSSIGNVKPNTLHNIVVNTSDNKYFISSTNNDFADDIRKISQFKFDALSECKADLLNRYNISDVLIFKNNYIKTNDYIIGKALERSVCCSILCDIARSITDSLYEYYLIFSAQNYCDKKGAAVASFGLDIDELYNLCAVDIQKEDIEQNKGPVVIMRDKNLISSDRLIEKLDKYENKQLLLSSNLICEGGFYARQADTLNVLSIGIPVNNLYCQNEMVSIADINSLSKIIKEIVLP